MISDRRLTPFPLTQATERTDKATAAILEGRVAILVDKSPYVILVPVTVNGLYQSSELFHGNGMAISQISSAFGSITVWFLWFDHCRSFDFNSCCFKRMHTLNEEYYTFITIIVNLTILG